MNNILLIFFCFFIFKQTSGDEIRTSMIINNCNLCHTNTSDNVKNIPYLKNLEKEYFLSKMYSYKKEKENSVMKRILIPLNELDIIEMADYLYGEN